MPTTIDSKRFTGLFLLRYFFQNIDGYLTISQELMKYNKNFNSLSFISF